MTSKQYLREYFSAAHELACSDLEGPTAELVSVLRELKLRGGRLFILGLGGSAANASHAVNDFRKISGIEAYSATENVAELTARVNDESFETSLVEWLSGSNLTYNDVVLVLSTSGGKYSDGRMKSAALVEAARWARRKSAQVVSIIGDPEGMLSLPEYSTLVIATPTLPQFMVPIAESFQAVIWHAACNALAKADA